MGSFIPRDTSALRPLTSACSSQRIQYSKDTFQQDALLLVQQPTFVPRQGAQPGGLLDHLLAIRQRLGKQAGGLAMQRTRLYQLPLRRLGDLADGLPLS